MKLVDESGVNVAMTRLFGRAPRGVRVPDAVPKNHGRNVTVLGALSCHNLRAVVTVEGAADAAVFRAYVRPVGDGQPERPQDSRHSGRHRRRRCAAAVFAGFLADQTGGSKLKISLRTAKARTREALEAALPEALDTIHCRRCPRLVRHCGYALQP